MSNIYAPPKADMTVQEPPAMPRPASVFLLQAIASVFLLGNVLVLFLGIGVWYRSGEPPLQQVHLFLWSFNTIAIGAMAALIVGLQRRSQLACLAGLICISLQIIAAVYAIATANLSRPNMGFALSVILIFTAGLIFWAYALGFSPTAQDYFRLKRANVPSVPNA